MIEDSIFAVLSADVALAALVGANVHHLFRPEGEEGSAVVFQRVSTVPVVSLAGESGLDSVRVQFSCVAGTGRDAILIATAVRECIKASALKGVPVMQITDIEEQTGQVRCIVDFNLWQ